MSGYDPNSLKHNHHNLMQVMTRVIAEFTSTDDILKIQSGSLSAIVTEAYNNNGK
jgi:hypothetical protein